MVCRRETEQPMTLTDRIVGIWPNIRRLEPKHNIVAVNRVHFPNKGAFDNIVLLMSC